MMTGRQPKEGIYRGEDSTLLGLVADLRRAGGNGKVQYRWQDRAHQPIWREGKLSDFTITRWGK